MNVYIDENIVYQYPADFILNTKKFSKNYDLIRGDTYINIGIYEKERWEIIQHSYLFSFHMKPVRLQHKPVSLGNDTWVEKYSEHGFKGIAIKFYSTQLSGKAKLWQTIFFVSRGQHYVYLSTSDVKEFSMSRVEKILSSIVFPDESTYKGFLRQGPSNNFGKKTKTLYVNYFN